MRRGMPPPKRFKKTVRLRAAHALETVTIEGIEVTQAVQDMAHTVTLVAGKPTVVRVYLGRTAGADITVRGEISVRRTASGPARNVPSLDAVRVSDELNGQLRRKREDLRFSLNFMLPEPLTTEGNLIIRLALVTNIGTGEEVVCTNASTEVRRVKLKPSPPLRVKLLRLRYQTQDPARTHAPAERDISLIKSWLRRVYPVGQTTFSERTIEANFAPPFDEEEDTCNVANAQLAVIRNLDIDGGADQRTHYYGMVTDSGGFMRGCANNIPMHADPTAVASGPTGPGGYSWDRDGSYGDWYGGHELAHTYGRFHPGFCNGNTDDDPLYPFQRGQISNDDGAFVGFDVGDPALGIPMRALPGASWHDVMTYCSRQWISSYTYEGIRRRLVREDILGPSPKTLMTKARAIVMEAASTMEVEMASGKFINIVGTVNLTKKTGKIRYVNPVTNALVPAQGKSRVQVRLNSDEDEELELYPVRVKENTCSDPGKDRTGIIDLIVPFNPKAGVVELLIDGEVVDTYRAGASPQAKSLRRSRSAKAASLEWDETQSANVSYNVQVSTDDGLTWQTLAVGRPTPDIKIDSNQFAPDTTLIIRVIATDGFNSRVVKTETFSV